MGKPSCVLLRLGEGLLLPSFLQAVACPTDRKALTGPTHSVLRQPSPFLLGPHSF